MYWGLVLKTNKRYSQQITKGFHVSNATLDLSTVEKDAVVSIWVHTDDSDHLLCNLSKQLPQVALDLVFSEGETIAFYSKGNGTVHLNGNIMQDDDYGMGDMGDDEELDEEAEDEEIENYADLKKALIKEKSAKTGKKSNEVEKEDSEEDSEDSDDEVDLGSEEDSDEDEEEDEDMLDDDDDDDVNEEDDEEEEEEEEEVAAPPAKKGKMEKEIKQNGVATNGTPAPKQNDQQKKQKGAPQEQSKKDKKQQQQQQQQTKQKPVKKTLSSGVIIEDLSPGKGPEATAGKRVTVYYIGRLQKTNKVFDSTQSGEGFKFHLGKSEVIRGWDIGVVGMRVGGKRRIVCPPGVAYGAKGQLPVIPGNATLVFDVTLRAIN